MSIVNPVKVITPKGVPAKIYLEKPSEASRPYLIDGCEMSVEIATLNGENLRKIMDAIDRMNKCDCLKGIAVSAFIQFNPGALTVDNPLGLGCVMVVEVFSKIGEEIDYSEKKNDNPQPINELTLAELGEEIVKRTECAVIIYKNPTNETESSPYTIRNSGDLFAILGALEHQKDLVREQLMRASFGEGDQPFE